MEKLDPEDFPEQLQMFAQDVTTFLDCLNEFPEFTDEAVNAAVLSLEGDLKVRILDFVQSTSTDGDLVVLGFVAEAVREGV